MKFFSIISFLAFVSVSIQLLGQDLQSYIERAKVNSPLIKENQNQMEAANLEVEQLKALYTRAQISLSGSYLFAPVVSSDNGTSKLVLNPSGSEEDYFGYDISASNGGTYQGIVTIDQPLFNGARYEANKELTLIGSQINENNIQLTTHELEKFVTDQYILCLQQYKETDYLKSLITIIDDHEKVVSKLVENGLANQSDLSLILIEKKSLLTELNKFNTSYRSSLMDLRIICGISDTAYQVLENIDLHLSEDVSNSQFVHKYDLDSMNLAASQRVFELKYKPIVGVFANGGLNAVYAPTLPNRFGLSAGINFTMNLTDGNQRKITQQRTEVLMRSTSQYKNFFYHQNSARKNRIAQELKSLDARQTLIEDQLSEYQRLLDLYKKELMYGQVSVFNYVSMLKNMVTTQRDFVLLQTNKALLINLYNYWNW